MYPFHSSGTRNSLLRHDTAEEKKRNLTMTKRSMYPFHSFVSRRQCLTEACLKRGALKKYLNCLTVLLYTVMYIPFGTK